MKIDVLTLFPEMFAPLKTSLIGKAQDKNLVDINIVDFREYSTEKHKKVDDYPYGGGAGMLIQAQPVYDAIMAHKKQGTKVIYMSPKGKVLNQSMVADLAKEEHLVLLCGHYEGIDQRAIDLCVDEEISIGDYVLTGGELPAMVLVDSILRYVPDVLHSGDSVVEESHSDGLLEYPQYTHPRNFQGLDVPEVLISGNHAKIAEWRQKESELLTKKQRPDMYRKYLKNKK
ncbi:MAG: tRNA (guanosine(37)-N1)-methyltransferase TrmD [Clostridiales bacterium]|nr:tRNA (guanosine(37)-N1)-methyltransferase TrmD [Clostridiales bacterium]